MIMRMQNVLVAAVLATGIWAGSFMSGDGVARGAEKPVVAAPVKEKEALDPPSAEWRRDPACQLVFFAVLEGLYTDGVPDEAVNLIVPPDAGKEGVKHSFVFRCPLCHAAYEAFVLYQNRTAFNGSGEKRSTLGGSFDVKIIEQLKAKDVRTRVFAMGALIRPWIERRMKLNKLDSKEQEALLKKLLAYAADGDKLFRQYRGDVKSVYHEWMFYGGCQACEAAERVARDMERGK